MVVGFYFYAGAMVVGFYFVVLYRSTSFMPCEFGVCSVPPPFFLFSMSSLSVTAWGSLVVGSLLGVGEMKKCFVYRGRVPCMSCGILSNIVATELHRHFRLCNMSRWPGQKAGHD